MTSPPVPTIRIDTDGHWRWDVALPDPAGHLTCDTIEDARRLAYRRAAERTRPCELLVRDAYHRVISRELIGAGAPHSG